MRDGRVSYDLNARSTTLVLIGARVIVFGLLVVVYLGSGAVPSAQAGDSAAMKCAANQDRVWVYESLGSFDVAAKLPCGATVEIVSRVKGFVRIHAGNGVEGYVPDSTFPGLPPLEDENNKPVGSATGLAAAAARARAAHSAPAPVPAPETPATVASNSDPFVVHASNATPSSTASPAINVLNNARAAASAAASTHASAAPPAASTIAAPVEIVLTTAPEVRTPASSAPSSPASGETVASASAPPAPTPAKPAAVAKKTPPVGNSPGAPTSGASAGTRPASATTTAVNSSSKSPATVASSAKSGTAKTGGSQPPAVGSNNSHMNVTPAPPQPSTPSSTKPTESAANLLTSRNVASVHPVAAVVESEDFPDSQVVNESDDPACQIFFSAYGLTPAQAKWMVQNRKKRFVNVCPAAGPAQVDFVILFTHDVDFYGSTMPSPVHTDKNGFSDFSPITMIDTAVIPLSEADKARHEFVWVFQMKRGSFDPSKFSPRRRYQFTKSESNSLTGSHASSRTVEDAFRYMEEQGPAR